MTKNIKSSTGKWEKFNSERYRLSLLRTTAPDALIENLIKSIEEAPEIRSSQDIYDYTYLYLKISDRSLAARYSLKQALYQLGFHPSAFLQFIGKMFMEQDYTVRMEHTLKGQCVDHDTHIIIERDELRYLIQCVYKKEPGHYMDISSVLSIKALFDDLSEYWKQSQKPALVCNKALLITNAHITPKALSFAACNDIELLGWHYPENADLSSMIHTQGLYPISCLTGLTKTQKIILIQMNFLLCRELLGRRNLLRKIQVPGKYRKSILDECKILSTPSPEKIDNHI